MLAVDLAHSWAFPRTPAQAAEWLAEQGIRVDPEEVDVQAMAGLHLAAAAALRAAARGESPPQGAVDEINAASAAASVAPQLNWPADGRPRMWLSTQSGSSGHALGILARAVIDLVTGPQRELLRICQAPGCTEVYLATNSRRLWCSSTCGNRVRVARHAARARAARDATG
jgi:predicted RNA-binding Zn ribbon-like protein